MFDRNQSANSDQLWGNSPENRVGNEDVKRLRDGAGVALDGR